MSSEKKEIQDPSNGAKIIQILISQITFTCKELKILRLVDKATSAAIGGRYFKTLRAPCGRYPFEDDTLRNMLAAAENLKMIRLYLGAGTDRTDEVACLLSSIRLSSTLGYMLIEGPEFDPDDFYPDTCFSPLLTILTLRSNTFLTMESLTITTLNIEEHAMTQLLSSGHVFPSLTTLRLTTIQSSWGGLHGVNFPKLQAFLLAACNLNQEDRRVLDGLSKRIPLVMEV